MWKLIDEAKNISDVVIELGNIICKKIIYYSKCKDKQDSTVTHNIYVEGNFNVNVSKFLKNTKDITVNYVMYFCENDAELNVSLNNTKYDCSTDYENMSITIVSGFILDNVESYFKAKVMHEINHLYEYDNGMQKRVKLYDKAIEMVYDKENVIRQFVGRAMYYSFKHEQDAFVHQFYGYLKQNKPTGSFKELVWKSEYKNANMMYEYLCRNYSNKDVQNAIREFGFSPNAFMCMIEHRLDRLYQKLFNAYRRYYSETNNYKSGTDVDISKGMLLYEQHVLKEKLYGVNIPHKMEKMYYNI